MVRLIEYELRGGRRILEEQTPGRCLAGHGIRYVRRAACPRCGVDCQHWECGHRGCNGRVVDPDHVHGDEKEWTTVVYLDGRTERRLR